MVLHFVGGGQGFSGATRLPFQTFWDGYHLFWAKFFHSFGCCDGSGIVTFLKVNT